MSRDKDLGEERVLRVRTFGECAIEIGERKIAPDAEIVFAILLTLSFELGAKIPRERIRRLLWPGLSERHELQCLRQALYKVRQFPGLPIDISPTHVSLRRENVDSDFAALLEPGWQKLFLNVAPPAGDFLPGYTPSFSEPFAEWLEHQRNLVEGRVRQAIGAAIAEHRSIGAWGTVAELARRCLQIDPLNEDATIALAESIALAGKKTDAIAVLDDYLTEVGPTQHAQPANTLRQRIAERLGGESYVRASEGIFVGREDSMRLLYDCTRRTRTGFSTSAFVWGEPGIGKSRLVDEFCRGAMLDGTQVLRVVCQTSDAERPLSVFVDLVPHLLALPGALGCSPESLSNLRRLSSTGAVEGGGATNSDEAEAIASGIRRAIYDLLDASSSETSLLIAIEDVHWCDPASLKLFGDIVTWCGSRHLQFLMTSRTPPALGGRATTELSDRLIVHRLASLEAGAASELLRSLAMTRGRTAEEGFVVWAVRVAEGNPFFLRELLRRWLETGELYSVPPTLGSLLQSRVAALQKRELRLLQACAVLRRHGRLDRLQALLGYDNLDVIEALESLGAAGLVVVEGEHSECRHELIVDAALQQLSGATRQALYRLAAEMLEKEAQDSTGMSLLWDCARLWHQSGDVERAVSAGIKCANQLTQLGTPSDSASVLEKLIDLCETDHQRLSVLEATSEALTASAQYGRLAGCIEGKRAIRARLGLRAVLHEHDELAMLDAQWRATVDPDAVFPSVLACLSSNESTKEHRVAAAVLGLTICDAACDERAALLIHTEATRGVEASQARNVDSLYAELIYHTTFGSLERAEAVAEALIEHSRATTSYATLCRALRYSANAFRRCGRHERAIESLTEAVESAERFQLHSGVIPAVEGLVQCYLEIDDISTARRWLNCGKDKLALAEDVGARISMQYLDAEIALVAGEAPPRYLLTDATLKRLGRSPVLRIRMYALSLFAGVATAFNVTVDAEIVDTLLRLHILTRNRGGQDFAAYCLNSVLKADDRFDEAASLMQAYLTGFRRERKAPPKRLADALLK